MRALNKTQRTVLDAMKASARESNKAAREAGWYGNGNGFEPRVKQGDAEAGRVAGKCLHILMDRPVATTRQVAEVLEGGEVTTERVSQISSVLQRLHIEGKLRKTFRIEEGRRIALWRL